MRKLVLAAALAAGVALVASAAHAGCSDSRLNSVRDSILASCQNASSNGNGPCTGNHGQYVSCVARAVSEAVRNNELDTNCKGKVVRCAARSTCGKKDGFVTCTICNPGTCTGGFCDDGTTTCIDSSTCPPVVDSCRTKSDSAKCVANASAPEGSFAVTAEGSCCHATCSVD